MDVSVVGWAATIAGLVVIFGLDILLMGRRPRVVGVREAALSVVGYVALAALFGVGVWLVAVRYRVLRRLHHRTQPVGGQLVRVRRHHDQLRRPAKPTS